MKKSKFVLPFVLLLGATGCTLTEQEMEKKLYNAVFNDCVKSDGQTSIPFCKECADGAVEDYKYMQSVPEKRINHEAWNNKGSTQNAFASVAQENARKKYTTQTTKQKQEDEMQNNN